MCCCLCIFQHDLDIHKTGLQKAIPTHAEESQRNQENTSKPEIQLTHAFSNHLTLDSHNTGNHIFKQRYMFSQPEKVSRNSYVRISTTPTHIPNDSGYQTPLVKDARPNSTVRRDEATRLFLARLAIAGLRPAYGTYLLDEGGDGTSVESLISEQYQVCT